MEEKALLKVEVCSLHECLFQGEASFLVLPGEMGELGIYPGHAPLLTSLRSGPLSIYVHNDQDLSHVYACSSGIAEVLNNTVRVYVDAAALSDESVDYDKVYKQYEDTLVRQSTEEQEFQRLMYAHRVSLLQAQLSALMLLKRKKRSA